jgi:hypothetical protein
LNREGVGAVYSRPVDRWRNKFSGVPVLAHRVRNRSEPALGFSCLFSDFLSRHSTPGPGKEVVMKRGRREVDIYFVRKLMSSKEAL